MSNVLQTTTTTTANSNSTDDARAHHESPTFDLDHEEAGMQMTAQGETPVGEHTMEQRVPVDRRVLEQMISFDARDLSDKVAPERSAKHFFAQVAEETGTQIVWPTRLKIGAKTKKDPYVRILGTKEAIANAKTTILTTLRSKHMRVTLKIDVSFTDHSHIIGRGGKNTQAVMRQTGCHIHFPDSNKNRDVEKSNQVSIAGLLPSVECARQNLRKLAPLTVTFTLCPLLPGVDIDYLCAHASLNKVCGCTDVSIMVRLDRDRPFALPTCVVRGSLHQEANIVRGANAMIRNFMMPDAEPVFTCSLEILPMEQRRVCGIDNRNMVVVAQKTGVHIKHPTFADGSTTFVFAGKTVQSVALARQYVVGLLPVQMSFEIRDAISDDVDFAELQHKHNVQIYAKWKNNQDGAPVKAITLRAAEFNLNGMYTARNALVGVVDACKSECTDYDFMKDFYSHLPAPINIGSGPPSFCAPPRPPYHPGFDVRLSPMPPIIAPVAHPGFEYPIMPIPPQPTAYGYQYDFDNAMLPPPTQVSPMLLSPVTVSVAAAPSSDLSPLSATYAPPNPTPVAPPPSPGAAIEMPHSGTEQKDTHEKEQNRNKCSKAEQEDNVEVSASAMIRDESQKEAKESTHSPRLLAAALSNQSSTIEYMTALRDQIDRDTASKSPSSQTIAAGVAASPALTNKLDETHLKDPSPEYSPLANGVLQISREMQRRKQPTSDPKNWRVVGAERQNGVNDYQRKRLLALKAMQEEPSGVRRPSDAWCGLGFSHTTHTELLRAVKPSTGSTLTSSLMREAPPSTSTVSTSNHVRSPASATAYESNSNNVAVSLPRRRSSQFRNSTVGQLPVLNENQMFDVSSASVASRQSNSNRNDTISATASSSLSSGVVIDFGSTTVFEQARSYDDLLPLCETTDDVLTAIGLCSLCQLFRDQEVDFDAFLGLDESDLREMGLKVTNRKKIHSAILKLRALHGSSTLSWL